VYIHPFIVAHNLVVVAANAHAEEQHRRDHLAVAQAHPGQVDRCQDTSTHLVKPGGMDTAQGHAVSDDAAAAVESAADLGDVHIFPRNTVLGTMQSLADAAAGVM
jgi:hypothetical protein